jgi:beta-N-acetylhexosaminidase
MLGYNFKSQASVKGITSTFRRAAGKRGVLLSVDMEGGSVQRLGRKLGYPSVSSAGSLAKRVSPEAAQAHFSKLAKISRSAGFNMNLAPVVDLLINPSNPVIGKWRRSYGKDPEKVTKYARAFVKAHMKEKVLPVLKHFPGHGSSRGDSHDGFVDISSTWEKQEMLPFAMLIESGDAPAIMPGHLVHKTIASDGMPVSISKAAITGVLRGRLKYQGLVVSDDLQMGAIAKNYGYRKTLIRAINAGVDMLMISNSRKPDPNLPRKTIAIIKDAIAKGEITPETIDAAYSRIKKAKSLVW